MKESKLKLKKVKLIQHDGRDTIRVWPPDDSKEKLFYGMQRLASALPKVVVCGIKSIQRAVVVKKEKADKGVKAGWNLKVPRYILIIEGRDLAHVKAVSGVDGRRTTSNHIVEVRFIVAAPALAAMCRPCCSMRIIKTFVLPIACAGYHDAVIRELNADAWPPCNISCRSCTPLSVMC